MTEPALSPYATYRFGLEIESVLLAFFTECQGLEAEIAVQEIVEGGLNDSIHQLPGKPKTAPRIVLKRGLAQTDLWDWYQELVAGSMQRRNLAVVMQGYVGMPQLRWTVQEALPVKWGGPQLRSDMNEVAFESLELVHRGVLFGGIAAGGSNQSGGNVQREALVQRNNVDQAVAVANVDLERLTQAVERLWQRERRIGHERFQGGQQQQRTRRRL